MGVVASRNTITTTGWKLADHSLTAVSFMRLFFHGIGIHTYTSPRVFILYKITVNYLEMRGNFPHNSSKASNLCASCIRIELLDVYGMSSETFVRDWEALAYMYANA